MPDKAIVHRINRLLMQMERNFTISNGIPGRPWFKHIVFGARYTYAVLLLPELTEAAEAGNWEGVDRALNHLEQSLEKSTDHMKEAIDILAIDLE
jgi:N-acetylated-alpha-linked acidic dipeptidase